MEELIRTMAHKVDNKEIVGYLVSCCVKDFAGDYQIITSARVTRDFHSPYRLYVPLLGKLFHTIAQGHPEPDKLVKRIIEGAVEEFTAAHQDESKTRGEFTVVGRL